MGGLLTTVAFFRVEGALLRRTAAGCAAWMALHQRDVAPRLGHLATVATAPLGRLLGAADPHLATRWLFRPLSGCSEDRLHVLAEDWWARGLDDAWNPAGLRLLDRCRAAGMPIVLLSDQPRLALGDLQTRLGAAELVCNRLEVQGGRATGKLVEPVFSGQIDGGGLARIAAAHGGDLRQAFGYGAHDDDATLLSAVGRPCAVTPDRALRRRALDFDWPIVEA